MKKIKAGSAVYAACAIVLCAACALSFFTFPRKERERARETYPCVWQDGSVTEENFYGVCEAFAMLDGNEIVLRRERSEGRIAAPGAAVCRAVLEEGDPARMLSYDYARLNGAERAALTALYGDVLFYYEEEFYELTADGVKRTNREKSYALAVLAGEPSSKELQKADAGKLILYPNGAISGRALRGTYVKECEAFAPYRVRAGAVYKDTPSGCRLVAALPQTTAFEAVGNEFADEGALLACRNLSEITVPFCGNDASGRGAAYRGEFAYLFCERGDYSVPKSLKKITVTGGRLVARAFFACENVEEIFCCGLNGDDVAADAFADCASLKRLHAPRSDLKFDGGVYRKTTAPCGCTVYEREAENER